MFFFFFSQQLFNISYTKYYWSRNHFIFFQAIKQYTNLTIIPEHLIYTVSLICLAVVFGCVACCFYCIFPCSCLLYNQQQQVFCHPSSPYCASSSANLTWCCGNQPRLRPFFFPGRPLHPVESSQQQKKKELKSLTQAKSSRTQGTHRESPLLALITSAPLGLKIISSVDPAALRAHCSN